LALRLQTEIDDLGRHVFDWLLDFALALNFVVPEEATTHGGDGGNEDE
jgi:hypothetical protein